MVRRLSKVAGAALAGLGIAALMGLNTTSARADDKPLGHYDSTSKDFWLHPPEDWWNGDETEAQRGLVPNAGQPLPRGGEEPAHRLGAEHRLGRLGWRDSVTKFPIKPTG